MIKNRAQISNSKNKIQANVKKIIGLLKLPQSLTVLILGLLMTLVSTFYVGWSQEREKRIKFDSEVKEIQSKILIRIEKYEISLLQADAFIQSHDFLTNEKFKNYVDTTEILNRYPGIQGIGYTIKVSDNRLQEHEKKMKSFKEDEYKGYAVWPKDPSREEYYPIIFLEPMNWRNERAIGYDMFSEPIRKLAMERARDSGNPAITGKVTLVQEIKKAEQPGFLIYVPIFKKGTNNTTIEDRRKNIIGFVYAPFRAHDLFSAIFKEQRTSLDFEVFDKNELTDESLIYDHNSKEHGPINKSNRKNYIVYELPIEGNSYFLALAPVDSPRWMMLFAIFGVGLLITSLTCWILILSKNAEAKIQESYDELEKERTKYEAVFEKSPTAIAILRGQSHVYEMTNPAYREFIGSRNVIGQNVRAALPELLNQSVFELLDEVFVSGKSISVKNAEVELMGPNGELRQKFADYTYHRIEEQGKPYGIFVQVIDITDKVLSRKRLETLSKELQHSLRARDEFLSIASHELKTPLTSLKLQSEVFKRKLKKNDPKLYGPEVLNEMAEQTSKQIIRLTRLVDDMFDIARIRSGKLVIEKETFNIVEMIQEVLGRMRPIFTASSYEFPSFNPNGQILIESDKLRIEQVFVNLLTNAIRYGKGNPISVEVEESERNVRFSVKDQGIGIAKENQEIIFDRFERAVNASEVSGLGLGLYITKQIVEAHDGKIWVESSANKGSTFIVELPKRV